MKKIIKGIAELPEKWLPNLFPRFQNQKKCCLKGSNWKCTKKPGIHFLFLLQDDNCVDINQISHELPNHSLCQVKFQIMVFVEEYIKSKAIYFIRCCFIVLQINCNLSVTPYPWPSEGASELLGWQLISIFLLYVLHDHLNWRTNAVKIPLTLPVPIPDEEKKSLNFSFHTFFWCLKRFYEGLKGL